MQDSDMHEAAEAKAAQEIAQDLDALRSLAARFRHLAPTAGEHVLRAILGKREALLESISARVSRSAQAAKRRDAGIAPEAASTQRDAFAKALADVAAMDRDAEGALRRRASEASAEIEKLRAGRKWRQTDTRWT